MHLKSIELAGFKSFAKKDVLKFTSAISGIVGPNGSGKSNVAEAFRFVLGEQSMKSMRGKRGEDLIFNGSPNVSRSNRAAVKVVFDNSNHLFDVDFDEVSIERTVHRDGVNQYAVNGSQVRLRDVVELLANANIGSSGHHIISQGEADRILNTSIRERREMVEDALGLKVYQYRKQESERKLEKTKENIEQVASIRKEILPHLRFLERQAGKIEKTLSLKEDLKELYADYLKREDIYLAHHTKAIEEKRKIPEKRLEVLEGELSKAKKVLEESKQSDEKSRQVVLFEEGIAEGRKKKEIASRDLGRIEGQITFEERRLLEEKRKETEGAGILVPLDDIERLSERVIGEIEPSKNTEDITELRTLLEWFLDVFREFITAKRSLGNDQGKAQVETNLEELTDEQTKLEETLKTLEEKEKKLYAEYEKLRKDIETGKDEGRDAEREVFRIMTEQGELRGHLEVAKAQGEKIRLEEEDRKREVSEGVVLIGRDIGEYRTFRIMDPEGNEIPEDTIVAESRSEQEKRRREIEKIKIRLEEAGGANSGEIMKEYKEVKERDEFFERELEDLTKGAESLREIILELEEKLDTQFKEGLGKINVEFQNFFSILFGGGTAKLLVIKQVKRIRTQDGAMEEEGEGQEEPLEEEVYAGLDVSVSLPNKRVKGLEMLSGGERALTSIALIFAMSQVNPPPFIILDETDAALDEANSKRYGDMIEDLAKKSQLILITHNRETMSRAGLLYGVTMGSDGVSKLLSVKLDEAARVEK